MTTPKTAVIIGAGPAGLTAAYELLTRTDIRPIILEKGDFIGGISRTVNYKGNRMDIGGHRFFSKSDRVMNWWLSQLPMEAGSESETNIAYQNQQRKVPAQAPASANNQSDVMLLRQRKSRIYYLRRFFDYPLSLSTNTLLKLGFWRTFKIGVSYCTSVVFPIRNEKTLEQFFINRFGRELYLTFFKSYTEKVWGVPCDVISAEWGAQRIKGLSILKTLSHAFKRLMPAKSGGIDQKNTETSLIEKFLYPKLGPGHMWESVARKVVEMGGEIHLNTAVSGIQARDGRVVSVSAVRNGAEQQFGGDYFFSTAPIRDLINSFAPAPPPNVVQVANGLVYRDFITVGVLARGLKISESNGNPKTLVKDNWIYIQEPDVRLGRLQIFNNWSPYLVADPNTAWLGLEYFCNESDELWSLSDTQMAELAIKELRQIDILDDTPVLDSTVIRVEKTYPAYFGTYDRFGEIREYLDSFANLFPVGRNGMHRYNNQDHSMLTAMTAVDNIIAGREDKANIWDVNTEQEYHEQNASAEQDQKAFAANAKAASTAPPQ